MSSAEEPIEPTGTPEPQAPPATAAEPAPESIPVREPQAQPAADARPAPESIPAPSSAPRTVGRAVADRLAAAGSRYAFTVPGESFLGLLDGLVAAGIEVVATRHEGGAAFMATAATQLTGKPQLCIATRAVGAANLAIGIHAARADSVPMIALVGQVPRRFRGRDAFQEADLVGSVGRLAKWAVEVDEPRRLEAALTEALQRAQSGRPGPVLICLPEDLLDTRAAGSGAGAAQSSSASPAATGAPRPPAPDDVAVRAVLRLMAASRRGVILAGAGVMRANASRRVLRLAEALGVPVIAAWRRPDVVPHGHPLYLGMAGYSSAPTVRTRLAEADAILVLGSRLNEITTFGYKVPGPSTKWAQVDLEPRQDGHGLSAPTIAVAADIGRFVDEALSLLRAGAIHAETRQARLNAAAADREDYLAASTVDGGHWDGPGVHPGRVVTELRRQLSAEAIITVDAGNFGGWVHRGYRFRRPGTFLAPTAGAMGYGLPAAIAAALVYPRRQVVAMCGDGGFAMSMNELETAVRQGAAPIALVFDNRRYGTIRMHQDREGRPPAGTELGPIDFAAAARSMGAHGISVDRDDQVSDAIREALASGQPTVLHMLLDPEWVSVDQPAVTRPEERSEEEDGGASAVAPANPGLPEQRAEREEPEEPEESAEREEPEEPEEADEPEEPEEPAVTAS